MKLALQLAYKNLIGAGLKTWLNVGILAFTYILIVFYNGVMDGWNRQAINESIAWENGAGQVWNEDYDPSDPFSILDGHGDVSAIDKENLVPILVRQGTLYPDGRMISILIKGIPADQTLLELPSSSLAVNLSGNAIIIGEKFAKSNSLEEGDEVLMRWRDSNGTFDAKSYKVAEIFTTNVAGVDAGQVWVDYNDLEKMTGLKSRASYLVASHNYKPKEMDGWIWNSNDKLLEGLFNIIASKKASGSILYILLLSIALLAIFDTQVLSIFRRQKEIGTYISLGMTRMQVVKLFTVEGAMYSIMAAGLAILVGAPILALTATYGIPMPEASQNAGVNMGSMITPYYGLSLILFTLFIVIFAATIVSYLPARRIAKMDPVNALKGKIQ